MKTTKPIPFNRRLWISLTIALVFLLLSFTGLLLYVIPYNSFFTGTHVWLGIIFTCAAVVHLSNNLGTLTNYLFERKAKIVITVIVLMIGMLVSGVYFGLKPFSSVLGFSSKLKRTVKVEDGSYQIITTNSNKNGKKITIEVKAGKYYRGHETPFLFDLSLTSPPQMAFWLEDMDGNLISTLYTTRKTSYPAIYSDYLFRSNTIFRPEALPYWFFKNKKQHANDDKVMFDAVTGATPHGHYDIHAYFPNGLQQFRVLAEINRSFDFNDYYTKDKYPDDQVYSGDGFPGQPSVIYATEINLKSEDNIYVMKPIGHGHYSGADGELYNDMAGIDTGLEIIKRIIVEIED